MLNKSERKKIQEQLPISKSHGYTLINEKLPHLTRGQICQAFKCDNRYKPEVMTAALEIIDDYKKSQVSIRKKIAAL